VSVRTREVGFITIQFVLATALSLMVFVMLANFLVFLYARGVVRAAVDEAARTGGRADAGVHQCEARADDVLTALLSGMRSDVQVECSVGTDVVRSEARVTLRGWLPPLTPDWSFTLVGQSVREGVG